MTKPALPSDPETVSEAVLSWLHNPPPQTLASQVAGWGAEAWQHARWTMQVHGIAPLLHQRLHPLPAWAQLPEPMQGWLREQHHLNRERLVRMMAELREVLQAAHDASIPLVPLKGSALVFHHYSDPALRPMADLDLLLRPQDEAALARLLDRLGYALTEATPRHRSYERRGPIQPLVTHGEHPDNPRGLELHTEVREAFWGIRYDVTEEMWAGEQASFGGAMARLAPPVALMQHLLIHASTDIIAGKARLVRLYDVALLGARLSETEWEVLLAAAHRRGEERLLFGPLLLTQRYLAFSPPAAVMETLERGTPAPLRAFLGRATLSYLSFCNPLSLTLRERLCWHRAGRERLSAILYRLFPPPEEIRQLHPDTALPLAYLAYGAALTDGARRRLLRVPRRPWQQREQGGK